VSGPLGTHYYPASGTNLNALINQGSRNATNAGLFHFTTLAAAGSRETNSIVDIGFHYAATDANGNPVDSDSDGTPDYLEDSDGDGALDSGETSVGSASDFGLRVFITEPKGSSNIP
jgi:hypothetical protein